LVEDDNH
jgi:hypothetical protein